MKEAFIQYVWQYQLFAKEDLKIDTGEQVEVISPGYWNRDAGPDFRQAIVRINDYIWAGDVEIHVRSSDWYRHKHHLDEKYKMVVLHVVYEHDLSVERQPGECFPTLELGSRISSSMYSQYERLTGALELLPCTDFLSEVSPVVRSSQMASMLMERMLRKEQELRSVVAQCKGDWREALYRQMAVSFGMKTNASAFELLAKSLPYKILYRHSASYLQLQALLFGQAGMLEVEQGDDFYTQLKAEYDYLHYKYQLSPIGMHHWNLLRLRPQNFPCIRISQFASILHAFPDLWEELTHDHSLQQWHAKLAVSADTYWSTHYHFNKTTAVHSVAIGEMAVALLLINTLVPMLFAYCRFKGEDGRLETVLEMLELLPFEDNRFTRCFSHTAFSQQNAADSQALMELYNFYCKERRCLECAIGDHIVKSSITI